MFFPKHSFSPTFFFFLMDNVSRLVHSINTLVREHGTPNGVGCSELHLLYNGPRPMDIGRVMRREDIVFRQRMSELGLVANYEDGRFYVEQIVT